MKTLLTLLTIISAQVVFAQTHPLFLIVEKGLVGYINAKGETVIAPTYWNGNDFSEGLAAVRKNGYYGFIDQKGDFVIKPEYELATGFLNGLAAVYKNGKVIFYEFSVIEQMDSGPVMKLRHFSPGNIGWEDKDKPYEYPLMFLEPDKARFERPDKKTALTFHRIGPDTMQVILERQDQDGRWVEDVFDYKLSK